MTPRKKASRVFLSAIGLLVVCAVATYVAFSYFIASERWVNHTQEVRAAVGEVESSINFAARARMAFLTSGGNADLDAYRQAVGLIPVEIDHLQSLVTDNAGQVARCAEFETLTQSRLRTWEQAIAAKSRGQAIDFAGVLETSVSLASQSAVLAEEIRNQEFKLLAARERITHERFIFACAALVASFVLSIALLFIQYRLLTGELQARQQAEDSARAGYEREAALRRDQERFRLFVGAVKDYALYILDLEGRVASWNPGAERIKGYEAEQIIGQHFSVFFTPEDIAAGKPQEELRIAADAGQFEGEGWRVRKDGSRFWANIVLTAIRDDEGKLTGFAKVTRDFTERMRVQEALRLTNVELASEVSERMAAQQKLADSERSLRELSLHLLQSQDEERKRIGRELHDSLGQYLAILKMTLDSFDPHTATPEETVEQIARCGRIAEDCIKEVRTISYLLYPPMLEEIGLKSAIPWYLEGFSKRSSIQTNFDVDPGFGRAPRDVELALFRVLQESLTNVHRHSGSSNADIRLFRNDGYAVVQIQDHGKGIPPALLHRSGGNGMSSMGVGLRGMHERILQLGGKLEISSSEKGTTVTATVPVGDGPTIPGN